MKKSPRTEVMEALEEWILRVSKSKTSAQWEVEALARVAEVYLNHCSLL